MGEIKEYTDFERSLLEVMEDMKNELSQVLNQIPFLQSKIVRCPKCNSDQINSGYPSPFIKCQCRDCDYVWSERV